jgi:hypothetical protein
MRMRYLADPFRLSAVLSLRVTRYVSLVVARSSRRWEHLVEQALSEPVLMRGWQGTAGTDPEPGTGRPAPTPAAPVVDPADGTRTDGADLTEEELADWAQMPFSTATARARELEGGDLRALLDYERSHGHRPRFEQLLQRRLDEAGHAAG